MAKNNAANLGNVSDDAQLTRSSGDFNSFTKKDTTIHDSDVILIEDSEDNHEKKKVLIKDILAKKYYIIGSISGTLPSNSTTPLTLTNLTNEGITVSSNSITFPANKKFLLNWSLRVAFGGLTTVKTKVEVTSGNADAFHFKHLEATAASFQDASIDASPGIAFIEVGGSSIQVQIRKVNGVNAAAITSESSGFWAWEI